MFVKIEGSYINLDLVYTIDANDDGTATPLVCRGRKCVPRCYRSRHEEH